MNFDILHDYIGQNVHLGFFEYPGTWPKLILLICNTFKEIFYDDEYK